MNIIKRVFWWLQVRSLEASIYGQSSCIDWMTDIDGDKLTLGRMQLARHFAKIELAKARSEYNATFRPGIRKVWKSA